MEPLELYVWEDDPITYYQAHPFTLRDRLTQEISNRRLDLVLALICIICIVLIWGYVK